MPLLSEDRKPFRLPPIRQSLSGQDESDLFSFAGSVGPNGENRREDVIKVQTLLKQTGDFDPDGVFKVPTGWPGSDLYRGIKAFQKRNGMQVDGTLLPIPPGGVDRNGVGESLQALRGELGDRFAGQKALTPSQVDAHYENQTHFRNTLAEQAASTSTQPQAVVMSDVPDAPPPAWRDGAQVAQASPSSEPQSQPAPFPQVKPVRLSDKGVELLKEFEEFRERRYPDQAGHSTIGYGHRIYPHEEKRFGETIDEPAARKLLAEDTAAAQRAVRQSVKIELNQTQFDALTSFAYNIGPTGFAKSDVVKKLNDGDVQGAADELLSYNKITVKGEKVPSKGLTTRRRREHELFLNGYK